MYSSAVLYVLSAIAPPVEYVEPFTELLIEAVRSSPVRIDPNVHYFPILSSACVILVVADTSQSDSRPVGVLLPEPGPPITANCETYLERAG